MRPSPNYPTSSKLTFDRDGARVIAIESDAVEVIDLVAIHLRTGIVLGAMQLARPTSNVAIDLDGTQVALRSDRVDMVRLDDLLRWSTTTTLPVRRTINAA